MKSIEILDPGMLLVASAGTFFLILVLAPIAKHLRLVDIPSGRKQHGSLVPLVGGISIYLVFLIGGAVTSAPEIFSWLIGSAGLLVVTGIIDDKVGLGVFQRFVMQAAATATMMFGCGVWIHTLGISGFILNNIPTYLGILITLIAVIGLTNSFNLVDGIDGLASGHFLIGMASMVGASLVTIGQFPDIHIISILTSSVLVFFLVNLNLTPLQRIFLGDSGSMLLGFILAWLLIYYSQGYEATLHPITTIWCVTLPVFDTLGVIASRIKRNKSPFVADRRHLHHMLVDSGLSQKNCLAVILVSSIILNCLGIWFVFIFSPSVSLAIYLLLATGFCIGLSYCKPANGERVRH